MKVNQIYEGDFKIKMTNSSLLFNPYTFLDNGSSQVCWLWKMKQDIKLV